MFVIFGLLKLMTKEMTTDGDTEVSEQVWIFFLQYRTPHV